MAAIAGVGALAPHVRSAKLRALVLTGDKRSAAMPEVATLAEQGISGANNESWFSLVAPKATPRDIVQRLNAEVRLALAAPELQRRFAELSLSVNPSTPEELDTIIKSEIVRWAEVIRKADIKPVE